MSTSGKNPPHACVIGWPVAHSRSPLIHNYWLRQYGIAGTYERAAVKPEDLESFLRGLAANGYAGCNVTVPHKEKAYALLDRPDAAARRLKAANTLWLEGDVLAGTNTDGYGFLASLDAQIPGWEARPGPAVILGAGGAARAVAAALAERRPGPMRILNRSRDRAMALAAELELDAEIVGWDKRASALAGAGLLVNTTSLGMVSSPPLDIDLAELPVSASVCDIVYAPLETQLLAGARARGNAVADGLGMLLHQAVPGFARWFGRTPEVTAELRALIAGDIEKELAPSAGQGAAGGGRP
jgi:shikimate dehydrogenase